MIDKDTNDENVCHLEITEEVYSIAILLTMIINRFVSDKSFSQLLDISPEIVTLLKTFNSKFNILKYGLLIKVLKH